jgi:hypothetical protein
MSENRSKGMYHSLIGKPSLRVVLVMGLLIGLCLLLFAACGGVNPAKGGAGQEHNKSTSESTSGGTASTDGLIAFRRWFDPFHSESAIFTMYPNGSHIRQITHPPEGWSDYSPAWSPDGTKVAFERSCRPSHCDGSRILVVDVNTGVTRSVTHCIPNRGWTKEHPPPSSAPYCVGDSQPAFSADGKSIAFRRIIGSGDESSIVEGIFMVGLDGSNPHQVTNVQKRGALEFEDFGPAFSPDGKMLVFEHFRVADEHTAVFVQSLDSSGSPEDAHQITPWKMNCEDGPEFSPKGEWVLFSCEGEGDPSNLYWVHPNGTGLHRLEDETVIEPCCELFARGYLGSGFSPSFSGEEGWITTSWVPPLYGLGPADVAVMRIDDGEVVRTTNLTKSEMDERDESAPDWSTHQPVTG